MKNIKNAFGGMIFGLILFILSFAILWWNEGNNAKNIATASYMQKNAIEIEASNIQDKNNGLLVAISAPAITDSILKDTNIKIANTLVLERTVEMYQWQEIEHRDSNDRTSYEYKKEWSESKINSDDFHDKNYKNPDFPIESRSFYAKSAKLGAFDLSTKQIERIVPEKKIENLPQNKKYSIQDGKYFSGSDIQNPAIGDVLISYSYAPSGTNISLIGKQQINQITSFQYKGRENYVQYNGILNKGMIIERYRNENSFLTISLRILGWLFMFIGLKILFNPIVAIFGFFPLLQNITDKLLSFVLFLISLVLSLITIAIAWFAYRPIFSICLIAVATGIVLLIKQKIKKEN